MRLRKIGRHRRNEQRRSLIVIDVSATPAGANLHRPTVTWPPDRCRQPGASKKMQRLRRDYGPRPQASTSMSAGYRPAPFCSPMASEATRRWSAAPLPAVSTRTASARQPTATGSCAGPWSLSAVQLSFSRESGARVASCQRFKRIPCNPLVLKSSRTNGSK